MAPNAAPYDIANMSVVTIVVLRSSGSEQRHDAGPLERPRGALALPGRRLRQERADDDERDGRDDAGHHRIAPRGVRLGDRSAEDRAQRRQRGSERYADAVDGRDEQSAERRKGLRVAKRRLAALGIGEQLRDPGDGGDELDADADEHEATKEEQHLDRRREPGQERGERIEKDAERQDAPAPEQIGQIPAEQTEDPAGERRNIEQPPDPHLVLGRSRRGADELQQRRPDDERQHQDLVDVEREADRGDRADQPLGWRESGRGRHGRL